MKTVFTYARVKWFYSQSERTYYLNYSIKNHIKYNLQLSKYNFLLYHTVCKRKTIITKVENFEKLQRVRLELKLETSPFQNLPF